MADEDLEASAVEMSVAVPTARHSDKADVDEPSSSAAISLPKEPPIVPFAIQDMLELDDIFSQIEKDEAIHGRAAPSLYILISGSLNRIVKFADGQSDATDLARAKDRLFIAHKCMQTYRRKC